MFAGDFPAWIEPASQNISIAKPNSAALFLAPLKYERKWGFSVHPSSLGKLVIHARLLRKPGFLLRFL
jgi:hypothetical protein